jgi:hypothetical protein
LGGGAEVDGLGASDGPPASGGGMRSTDSFPLDPQLLLDKARLAHGSVCVLDDSMGLPGSISSDDTDSGDEGEDEALPDFRRLNENLESRPCPVFRNGGAITRSSLACRVYPQAVRKNDTPASARTYVHRPSVLAPPRESEREEEGCLVAAGARG